MKKILLTFLIFLPLTAQAQWIKGFNFRDTAAYCTDTGNDTYAQMIDGGQNGNAFPTTRNSVTFGDTGNHNTDSRRDRYAAGNCKLAGNNFYTNNAAITKDWRVTLPAAGQYKIRLAFGDYWNSQADRPQVFIFDNTTLVATIGSTSTLAGDKWLDATEVIRTNQADWVANNAQAGPYTFATTTFIMKVGRGNSSSGRTVLAHLEIEQEVPSGKLLRHNCTSGSDCRLNFSGGSTSGGAQ